MGNKGKRKLPRAPRRAAPLHFYSLAIWFGRNRRPVCLRFAFSHLYSLLPSPFLSPFLSLSLFRSFEGTARCCTGYSSYVYVCARVRAHILPSASHSRACTANDKQPHVHRTAESESDSRTCHAVSSRFFATALLPFVRKPAVIPWFSFFPFVSCCLFRFGLRGFENFAECAVVCDCLRVAANRNAFYRGIGILYYHRF